MMKRGILLIALAAVFVLALASAALADVAGTHHDMRAFTGQASGDTCYPCHGIKETSAGIPALGQIGSMCYLRCHSSDTGQAGTITLDTAFPEKGVFDNTTRVLGISAYTGVLQDKYTAHRFLKSSIPTPDLSSDVTATAWPHTSGALMECTSCHDVHNNTFTPFLWDNLSNNTTPNNSFCQRCHRTNSTDGTGSNRYVLVGNPPNGAHPVEVAGSGSVMTGNNGRLGRTIAFKDVVGGDNSAVFRNGSVSGTGLNASTAHYNPGGKLGNFGTAATGKVGCYTCHATHMPAQANMSQLTVAQWRAAGATPRPQNDMCVGCHGAATGAVANPGTTAYYHPANYETLVVDNSVRAASIYRVTTGSFTITVNMDNTDVGANSYVVCSSCHGRTDAGSLAGVHAGVAQTAIINPAKPTCGSCHGNVTVNFNLANSHHVYGTTTNYTAAAAGGYTSPVNYGGTPATSANLSDGLSCEDCHIFNGTAHNWN